MALTWAPVDWNGIAQARAIQLRPELAAPAKPVKKPAKPEPESSAINAANGETNTADANKNGSDSQPPIIKPIAEKVPNNLDISKYAYDPATESCNADMMMVGDSVTSGTSGRHPGRIPERFYRWPAEPSAAAGGGCVSAGHRCRPQWQCGGVWPRHERRDFE